MKRLLSKKKDIKNLLSLSTIQGANAIFPVLVFPYIYVSLGPDAYSKIVVAEVIAFYVLIISLYSFDVIGIKALLVGKREERGEKEERVRIASYFWNVLHARLLLFLTSSIIALIFVYVFSESHFLYLVAWLFFPLGMVLQNNYYFLAKEKNHILAFWVIFFRIISAVWIYIFSGGADDPVIFVFVVAVSFFLSGLASIIYLLVVEKIEYHPPQMEKVKESLMNGKVVFLGGASVILFRGSNTLILAIASVEPHLISMYSLAEKFIKMLQATVRPLSQLYFPKTIKLLADTSSKYDALVKIISYTKPQVYISLILALTFLAVVYFDASHLNVFFNYDLLLLISIMILAVVFGIANYMLGTVGIVAIRGEKYYTYTLTAIGALSVISCYILASYYKDVGAAVAYVGSELALFILFLRYYKE